ncbi:MAG: histone family protein DNA-binding protein [Nevskia sp.]|nr:histone family protein DNA-binding protein [Nevskia sp.]
MTKDDLLAAVSAKLGIPKSQANELVTLLFDQIGTALEQGERVSLPGFGAFTVTERAARTGRNPGTGAAIDIPAKKVVKFSPASALEQSVNK